MHTYSIETDERKNIILIMVALSLILSWSLHVALTVLKINIPWWGESPSILFIFNIIYTYFDNEIWKHPKFKKIVKTPNLNGSWKGYLTTSFDRNSTKIPTELEIIQTWTKMKVTLRTKTSFSISEVASIITNQTSECSLFYQYINEPNQNALGTMHIHHGSVKLCFNKRNKTLTGEYYSGRDRQNFGILYFKKVS